MAADKKLSIEIAAIDAFSKTFTTVQNELQDLQRQASKSFGATPAAIQGELAHLQGEFNKSTEKMAKASNAATATMTHGVAKTTETVGGLNLALGNMIQFVAGAFSVSAIIAFGKETFNTTLAVDAINSKLKVLTGSTKAAGQEWESVRSEAERLRLDLKSTEDSYSSFAVATKNTSMEGEASRLFFIGVAEAITALHLPAENGSRILYQFQQMLSKGKVNMEDLKTASESFPGLLKMVADALGITTSQLMDQMQKGELMASEVLPKLGEQLHKVYGQQAVEEANKGRGAVNELTTAVFNLKNTFGEASQSSSGGILGFLTAVTNKARESITLVQQWKIANEATFAKVDAVKAAGWWSLLKPDPEARAELKAEFAAIDQLYQHHWDKTVQISKLGAQKQEGEDARNSQRRRDEARKTGEDLAKINLDYARQTNQAENLLTAEMEKEYQERLKDIKTYYDQKKAASKSDGEELAWERTKTDKLKELAQQHARDNEIITAQMVQRAVDLRKEGLGMEIAAIKQQALDHTITAAEAEARITTLTITSLREQYEARQYLASKVGEIYGKDSENYKKVLKEQQSSHKAYLDANMAAYKTYSDKIKALDQQIADFRRSIAEKISDLKQKGMTDEQKYADNLRRFNEAIDAAESARRQKKTEDALRYNKQAEDLAGRLADTQIKGIDGIQSATDALQRVEENRVKTLEDQKQEVQENLDKLKTLNEQKLDPKKLEINLDEATLARVNEELAKLTRPETKKITIEMITPSGTVPIGESYNNSDLVKISGMATGGRVGGSGIGDTQLRALDPREFVLRPEATAFWNEGELAAFNAPWSSFGQAIASRLKGASLPNIPMAPSFTMANGGRVGNMADMGTINIAIGGVSYPVMGKVDVLADLKNALRRETLVRKQ
jgi:tape measure domain-containing protein